MAKIGYQLPDGNIVHNFREIAEALGVERVTREDIAAGGQFADLVTQVELEDTSEPDTGKKDEQPANTNTTDTKEEDIDKTKIYTTVNPEEVTADAKEILEVFGQPKNIEELKGIIKDIDTPTLEFMARALKLEWTPTYHASIHRMRIALAIQKYFFPALFKTKKESGKKAKYGDFSTEDLISMAREFKVDWTRTGNDPIDRMKVIMALKKSGHLAE